MGLFNFISKTQDKLLEKQEKVTEKFEGVQKKIEAYTNQYNANHIESEYSDYCDEEGNTKKSQKETSRLESQLIKLQKEVANLKAERDELKKEIFDFDETILLQEFGLYKPKFDFCSAEEYKNALTDVREKQKELIKNDLAVTGSTKWTINNSASQGRKMVNDMKKLLLRAFNTECDEIVTKVKYNNIDASVNRLEKSRDAISKLGTIMDISINNHYYKLKEQELYIALEYQIKKQEEKEALRELREQQREEAKLQKEIEAERKKIEKEQKHFLNALKSINDQLAKGEGDQEALLAKQQEIEKELGEIEKALVDIDYREANQKAGFVYVISNVGSFGPDVYKIGMTRRLDPTERVDELGDASVPFNFDIHAMIFSDNAPALEAALHRAFEKKKVNLVNSRREFFNVTLEEIKNEVKKNHSKTTEWFDEPDAEQYRISLKMRNQN